VRCFASVARHLSDDGVFVIEASCRISRGSTRGSGSRRWRSAVDRAVLLASRHDPGTQTVRVLQMASNRASHRTYPVPPAVTASRRAGPDGAAPVVCGCATGGAGGPGAVHGRQRPSRQRVRARPGLVRSTSSRSSRDLLRAAPRVAPRRAIADGWWMSACTTSATTRATGTARRTTLVGAARDGHEGRTHLRGGRVLGDGPKRSWCSRAGRRLDQALVRELTGGPWLVLVAGRYEGVDERVVEGAAAEEVSIGDYVLSGGEIPASSARSGDPADPRRRRPRGVRGADSFAEPGLLDHRITRGRGSFGASRCRTCWCRPPRRSRTLAPGGGARETRRNRPDLLSDREGRRHDRSGA